MKTNNFVCPICGNNNVNSIGIINGKPYCRKCISFRGEGIKFNIHHTNSAPTYLKYKLSFQQKELSNKLIENFKNGINSFVYAICGSPKTTNP